MDLVGRALELPPAVNDILGRTMDASIAEARNGRLGTAGRNLACSFLHLLALTPRVRAPEGSSGAFRRRISAGADQDVHPG
jgi:hypothetical protein